MLVLMVVHAVQVRRGEGEPGLRRGRPPTPPPAARSRGWPTRGALTAQTRSAATRRRASETSSTSARSSSPSSSSTVRAAPPPASPSIVHRPPPRACAGHNLNYFTTGISVRGTAGGAYFSKRRRGWFDGKRPWLLSIESPVDPVRDTGRERHARMTSPPPAPPRVRRRTWGRTAGPCSACAAHSSTRTHSSPAPSASTPVRARGWGVRAR